MSIFRCDRCGCVENTAVCNYWSRKYLGDGKTKQPPLCSECDPKIGKWHGVFPKKSAKGYILASDGFLYHPDDIETIKRMKLTIVKTIEE